MKLATNGDLYRVREPLEALAAPQNRLGTIPDRIRATRNSKAVQEAWAAPGKEFDALILEHGEAEDGKHSIGPTMPGWQAFSDACDELFALPADVEIEPIAMSSIESGYAKTEKGREPIDISGPHLDTLVDLGIVTEG